MRGRSIVSKTFVGGTFEYSGDALPEIMKSVEEVTGITREQMYMKKGAEEIMIARHLFHIVAYRITVCDQGKISKETRKNRSTLTSSVVTALGLLKTNDSFIEKYDEIMNSLKDKLNKYAVKNN